MLSPTDLLLADAAEAALPTAVADELVFAGLDSPAALAEALPISASRATQLLEPNGLDLQTALWLIKELGLEV